MSNANGSRISSNLKGSNVTYAHQDKQPANEPHDPVSLLEDLLVRLDGAERFAAERDQLPELVRLLELRAAAIHRLID